MKYFVICVCICAPWLVWGETIRTYTTDLELDRNGSLSVRETIVFYSTSESEMIFNRHIPIRFQDQGNELGRQKIQIVNPTATWNRSNQLITVSEDERSVDLIIGDPLQELSAGKQEIVISYTVLGALRHGTQNSQIVWEAVSGQEYDEIQQFAASINTPIEYPIDQASCYWETLFNTHKCSIDSRIEGKSIAYFAHTNVDHNHGVTITVDFERGLQGEVFLARFTTAEWALIVLGIITVIVGLIVLVFVVRRKTAKTRKQNRNN